MSGKNGKWMGLAKQAMDKMSDEKDGSKHNAQDNTHEAKPQAPTGEPSGPAEKVMKQVGRHVDGMMNRKHH